MLGKCSLNTYLHFLLYCQYLTSEKVGVGGVSKKKIKLQGNEPWGSPPTALNAMRVVQWATLVAHWAVRSAQASGDADKAAVEIEAASDKIEADSIKTEGPSAKLERPSAEIKTASAEIEGL